VSKKDVKEIWVESEVDSKRMTNETESKCKYKKSTVELSIQSKISVINSEKKRKEDYKSIYKLK